MCFQSFLMEFMFFPRFFNKICIFSVIILQSFEETCISSPILWWNIHFFRRLWQNLHFFQWSLMMKCVEFFIIIFCKNLYFFWNLLTKFTFFFKILWGIFFFFFKRSFDTIYVFSRFLHKIYDSLMKLVIFSANIWSIFFFFVTICGNLWYFYVWTFQKKKKHSSCPSSKNLILTHLFNKCCLQSKY